MSQISFFRKPNQTDDGKKSRQYDIEYTQPQADTPNQANPTTAFDWFGHKINQPITKPVASAPVPAASAATPLKTVPLASAPASAPTATALPPSAPLPVSVIPTAPPPPIHLQTINQQPNTVAVPPRPTPQPVVSQPVVRQPIAPVPMAATPAPVVAPAFTPVAAQPGGPAGRLPNAASVASAPMTTAPAPAPTGRVASSIDVPGTIHVQNVSHNKGPVTNPGVLPASKLHLNLMPTQGKVKTLPASLKLLRWTVVAVTIVAVVYIGMIAYQSYYLFAIRSAQTEVAQLDQAITEYTPLYHDIQKTQGQIDAVNTLLDQHVYWTTVLALLEDSTLSNVFYTSLSGTTAGTLNIQAITSDFSTIAKQVAVLRLQPAVQKVTVTTATRTPTANPDDPQVTGSVIEFTISLQLDPVTLTQPRYESDF